ncbi:MAG: hypothetical protein AAFQ83_21685 [Bacteroidota bacterium]
MRKAIQSLEANQQEKVLARIVQAGTILSLSALIIAGIRPIPQDKGTLPEDHHTWVAEETIPELYFLDSVRQQKQSLDADSTKRLPLSSPK